MHASLYNFELIKLEHEEAQRLATDARWESVVRRARRRTGRALWTKATTKVTPARATAGRAVAG